MVEIATNIGSPLGDVSSIEREWDDFVQRHGLTNPDAYLDAVRIEPWMLGSIQIGLTNSCNLACDFCFLHANNSLNDLQRSRMTADDLIGFCRRNAPIKEVIFTNYGEVFQFKGALQLMEALGGYVGGFAMNTNGLILDEDKIARLADLPVNRLSVSVEASDAETYARYRKKGHFDLLCANVALLTKYLGDRVLLTSVVSTGNADSVLKMPQLFAPLGIRRIDVQGMLAHERFSRADMTPLQERELEDFVVAFVKACDAHGVTPGVGAGMATLASAPRINARVERMLLDEAFFVRTCFDPMRSMQFDPDWNFAFCCAHQLYPAQGRAPDLRDIVNIPPVLKNRALLLLRAPPKACIDMCFPDGGLEPVIDYGGVVSKAGSVSMMAIRELLDFGDPQPPPSSALAVWPGSDQEPSRAAAAVRALGMDVVTVLDHDGAPLSGAAQQGQAILIWCPNAAAQPQTWVRALVHVINRRLWNTPVYLMGNPHSARRLSPHAKFRNALLPREAEECRIS